MLSHYYDINQAGMFKTLFGDLYIGKHPTPKHNTYLVLNLDFSGLDTADEEYFQTSLSLKIQDTVRGFLDKYKHLFPSGNIYSEQINTEQPGVRALQKAFNAAASAGKKIFIIIDEYDHYVNDLIVQRTFEDTDFYRHTARINRAVRDFYDVLKEGSKTVVDRIILTGIMPVMLDSMTGGFNISNNLSFKKKYNEMLGFTQDEVNTLMKETGIKPEMIRVDMELLYSGYLFHPDGEYRLYNPSMILYLFDFIVNNEPVGNIIDENLKPDYSYLRCLIQNSINCEQLIQIAQNNRIFSEIIPKVPIGKMQSSEYFASMLFYLGMLTIDCLESGKTYLKIPNYSTTTIYWEYTMELMRYRSNKVKINQWIQLDTISTLAYEGNPKPYIDFVNRNILQHLSNCDLRQLCDKHIKIILLSGLFRSGMFVTITELEAGFCYVDIYIQRSHLQPDIPYEWVWEIKYIKKQDSDDENILNEKREEVRAQLKKHSDSPLFADRTDIRYLSLIFIGKRRFELEEILC
jgi:hypothetical protein